jgi:SAM-dependent methyltransferase
VAQDLYASFAPYYDSVYRDVVDYDGDARFLRGAFERLSKVPVRRVLDLGCGTGSHAIALARLGYEVEGLDLSARLLDVARSKAAAEPKLSLRFREGDMSRELPPGPFDAVTSLFGAFACVTDDEAAERVLAGVAKLVPKGGLFVFESWNALGVVEEIAWDTTDLPDGRTVLRLIDTSYDARASVVSLEMDVLVIRGDRIEERFPEPHRLRARTPRETSGLLERHGFELLHVLPSAVEGERSFDEEAPHDELRVLIVARRV